MTDKTPEVDSRSRLRRIAAQKGEPAPTFEPDLIRELDELWENSIAETDGHEAYHAFRDAICAAYPRLRELVHSAAPDPVQAFINAQRDLEPDERDAIQRFVDSEHSAAPGKPAAVPNRLRALPGESFEHWWSRYSAPFLWTKDQRDAARDAWLARENVPAAAPQIDVP